MNDFSELEKELRKLRPTQPSPVLFERVGDALKNSRAAAADAKWTRWRFTETPYNWWSLGFGLAAAAVLILFAAVTMERRHEQQQTVAQISPRPKHDQLRSGRNDPYLPAGSFLPVGRTSFITRAMKDCILLTAQNDRCDVFAISTQQTWRWRNPETGASLRVSYPSEEVVLIPVSGQ